MDDRYTPGQASVLHSARIDRNVILERGLGSTVWDNQGNTYLDLLSANMGPTMVGYGHPRVVDAVRRQFETLSSTRIVFDNSAQIDYCRELSEVSPFSAAKTYLCPGGGEANEAAVKLAMVITGRPGVVSLAGAYHGQSVGTMSLCGMPALRDRIPPQLRLGSYRQVIPGHRYRPWSEEGPDWRESLAALEADLARSPDVAAFIMEPIQAVAGHVEYVPEFCDAVARLCERFGILLIVDEVQTGLGRCGQWWACEIYGIKPDILTIGKAGGGGMPFGAVIANADLIDDAVEREPWHLLTAQGHPVQAAAGSAVLAVIREEGLVERSRVLGERAAAAFRELADSYEAIGDVRCPGLFIGVDLVEERDTRAPATAACAGAWDHAMSSGLITEFAGRAQNVMKFKPPLTTSDSELEQMLERSERVIRYVDERVGADERRTAKTA
jgi:4-aminobutyrate aminotransferase-like enzyme